LKHRQSLIEGISRDQQTSIQNHNQSMQESHENIQKRLQAMDQEFSGSVLHVTKVSVDARDTERYIKSYQKHLQQTGQALDLMRD